METLNGRRCGLRLRGTVSAESFRDALESVARTSPLVHHLTNAVTMNDCANITLAVGASPVMTACPEDAIEMVGCAGALVLNIGTLTPASTEAMIAVGKAAKSKGIPVVFDPVGAAATKARREASLCILAEVCPDIVKGNASEIAFLAGHNLAQRGVDSGAVAGVDEACRRLALVARCVAVATGATDCISDGETAWLVRGGSAMMARITGTGCMGASVAASFAASCKEMLTAAACASLAMKLGGEIAERNLADNEGCGAYRSRLLDAMSLLSRLEPDVEGRIERVG